MESRKPRNEKAEFVHGILMIIGKDIQDACNTVDQTEGLRALAFRIKVQTVLEITLNKFYDEIRNSPVGQMYWPMVSKGFRMAMKEFTSSSPASKDKSTKSQ